jgi:hypothetical protein
VRRGAKETLIKHIAIVSMIDMLQDQCPFANLRDTAESVVVGFHDAGIDRRLTVENVVTIYGRGPAGKRLV